MERTVRPRSPGAPGSRCLANVGQPGVGIRPSPDASPDTPSSLVSDFLVSDAPFPRCPVGCPGIHLCTRGGEPGRVPHLSVSRYRKAHRPPRRQTSAPCSGFARPAPRGRNLDASVPRPCAPSPTPTGGSPSPSPSPPLTRTRCFEEATPSAPPIRSPCLVCTRPSPTSPATGGSSASFARRAPPAARTRNGAPARPPRTGCSPLLAIRLA